MVQTHARTIAQTTPHRTSYSRANYPPLPHRPTTSQNPPPRTTLTQSQTAAP
jgi:hypothetical protein